jgi:RecB family exonuclease
VADLHAFRRAAISLACEGQPLEARDRLVVVPTRAAAAHLRNGIEDWSLETSGAVMLPDLITPSEVIARLAERLDLALPILNDVEREALLGAACGAAMDEGYEPPFQIRPGLISEILRFHDDLRRRGNSVDDFARRVLNILEPGASSDRGAERLVRQTRFLVAAFREFERRSVEHGLDEHDRRERVATTAARRPYRHIVLTVSDASFDPNGLFPADWDLLTRVPRLDRLDVVVTDAMIAGALHERIHQMLPGIEEVRFDDPTGHVPVLLTPSLESRLHRARDREDEVAGFARRVKADARRGVLASPSRAALVVRRPLPYVYVAREVLRSAGIPCQMFDTLPLAAEPYAAAVDLVLSCVSANFARGPAIALMRSPHFMFTVRLKPDTTYADTVRLKPDTTYADTVRLKPHTTYADTVRLKPDTTYADTVRLKQDTTYADTVWLPSTSLRPGKPDTTYADDVPALDRALAEAGYLGDVDTLERLLVSWRALDPTGGQRLRALRAGEVLLGIARELQPLRSSASTSDHLSRLIEFLTAHRRGDDADAGSREQDPAYAARERRARGAILATLVMLRDAWARFDATAVGSDAVAALVRRWIETQTFAPRTAESGVHVIDASSAPFGDFDYVHLAGVVDGEWPDSPRRNIFYSAPILRELNWPSESDRLTGARAAFADLLRLPSSRVSVSVFTLEGDALVSPSPFVDEIDRADLDVFLDDGTPDRIFDYEALCLEPVDASPLSALAREWALRRWRRDNRTDQRYRGWTAAPPATAYSVSAFERYQDCPFKFFASDILRLEEVPEDESTLSPRARGRFIHEVFQRFFEAWDARGVGAITADRHDEARALMAEVAEPLLARLPEAEAALERARLFGSAISTGSVDVVFEREVSSPADVVQRLLEHRLEGEFSLGSADGHLVRLTGIADRIDLLDGHRLRLVDYKSGSAPNPRRALQVPIYALSAQERLSARDGQPWTIDDAAYIAFTGKRSYVPVIRAGATGADEALNNARRRLFAVVDGIARGEFPPRPHDPMICTYCAFATVCRKDYVERE